MIFKTKRAASRAALKHEKVVTVMSKTKACELGCHCIPRPKATRLGWALVLALAVSSIGCVTPNPEATALSTQVRHRQGAINRNCLDFEKAARPAAISDCRYYARRARRTLTSKVYSDLPLARAAIKECGLPKTKGSARATALHNERTNLCYHKVFSTSGGE